MSSIHDVIDGLVPSARLANGVPVSYRDGQIDCDWFGETISIKVEEISLESVMRLGVEDTLLRHLSLYAPVTALEFSLHGRLVASPYGIESWVNRGGRFIPWISSLPRENPCAPSIEDFSVTISGGVVVVSSITSDRLPHESGAWGVGMLQSILGDTFTLDTNSRVAVSPNPATLFTVGHFHLLERLCDTSNGSLHCLSPENLQSIR